MSTGIRIHINGVVQGVGFRPFVYNLAAEMGLNGWVCNTSAGVDIEADGEQGELERFAARLLTQAPPLSKIDEVTKSWIHAQGFKRFEIVHSQDDPEAFVPISPDVTICPDCLTELFDPEDRRYRYPFINCTNCGPRFTIITAIPYDRPNTTMASFPMCPDCEAEYTNPADRRFHAQPAACPECGPQVWLELSGNTEQIAEKEGASQAARDLLKSGRIVAIKGLGGFHLACDAANEDAVAELRSRKLRVDKPFAVMMPDVKAVSRYCQVSPAEAALIESRERPIVIVPENGNSLLSPSLAPGQYTLGVMLPYTPLHALLLEPERGFPDALVMTSGNLSEEPLSIDNQQARERLSTLADAFLLHDRDINIRCDDSVVRAAPSPANQTILFPLRRSRGYAPYPVRTPWEMPPILATGAELKNTFCLTKDRYAFISHHIGDLENYETLAAYEHGIRHIEKLFRIKPESVAYDLHPDYLATRYAQQRAETQGLPALGIQHHHAHAAACMAEHDHPHDLPLIALTYDGTGYGSDGTIWGGEVLITTYQSFRRAFHLMPIPLPGGDAAVRDVWRIGLSWLLQAGIDPAAVPSFDQIEPEKIQIVGRQVEQGLNAPQTSSMGRLFDAVSALAGVRQSVNYEGQAAIEFEALADPDEKGAYPFELAAPLIDPSEMIRQVAADRQAGISASVISARFHNTIALLSRDVCRYLKNLHGISTVALSGGVWQNLILLQSTIDLLAADRFTVYIHEKVPTNDGGLAFGQAVIAYHTLVHEEP